MGIESIDNYVKINKKIALSGQPSEDQIKSISKEKYDIIINIAPTDPRYSLEDEEKLTKSLGMIYVHIPVDFKKPTEDDLNKFFNAMNLYKDKRIFVHCAANYRVTVFYSLYEMRYNGMDEASANDLISSVWNPEECHPWPTFICDMRNMIRNRT